MISLSNVKAVFKKEFLQVMRDKSVIFTNFFIPLFGVPLYLILVIEATKYMHTKQNIPLKDDTIFTVSYQGKLSKNLIETLSSDKKIKLRSLNTTLSEEDIIDYREKFNQYLKLNDQKKQPIRTLTEDNRIALKEGHDVLIKAKSEYVHSLNKLKQKYDVNNDLHIAVFENKENVLVSYFFHTKEKNTSSAAKKYVKTIFQDYEDKLITKFKESNNILVKDLNPIVYWDINLDKSQNIFAKAFGLGLGGTILFLLLISIFNPTINTTIGERDQNTFKVLLMNPISLHEIFIGKYLNIALQGLITLVPYAVQTIVFYSWGSSNLFFSLLPEMTLLMLSLLFLGTLSVATLISSMCFLTCSFAKTRVQAQSLITLLMFALMIPIGTVGVMDIKLTALSSFAPLINFPISLENMMLAEPNYSAIIVGILVNFCASMAIIWFSLGAFLVQWKGSSDMKGLSDILTMKKRKSSYLSPAHAFLAFAISFLGYTYGSVVFISLEIELFSYLFAPLLFCLGTAVLITQYSGLDFTTTFNWSGLSWKYAVKLICSAFVLSFVINLLLRDTVALEMFKLDFPVLFESNQFASYFSYFLLFAVVPGFAEEILFRGIIYKGLRKQYNLLISSVISSALFAVIHFSMFKWGHTFLIGLFLALIYEHRGLFSCILFHTAFNGFSLLISLNKNMIEIVSGASGWIKVLIVPAALFLVYVLVVRKSNLEEDQVLTK